MPACQDKLIFWYIRVNDNKLEQKARLGYRDGRKQKNDFLSGNGYNDNDNCPPENSNTTCEAY
jgi:hypothetical protein